jgi:type IV secretory pathway ATPase VirB11/archaellum biosynthesis ATPase
MADSEYVAAMARFLGPRVCELFADERVVEVYVNGDLVVRTDGVGGRLETDLVLSEESIRGFLNIAATREGISLGGEESTCEIAAELPAEIFGKARLQGMVPPLVEVPTFVVRKHPARIMLLPELVACGSASAEQYAVLKEALAGGESIIVSGATKSGKTNLVNALLHELVAIRPEVRVVVLEDTPEVVCPACDTLRMVTVEKRVDLHDLVGSVFAVIPTSSSSGRSEAAPPTRFSTRWQPATGAGCARFTREALWGLSSGSTGWRGWGPRESRNSTP